MSYNSLNNQENFFFIFDNKPAFNYKKLHIPNNVKYYVSSGNLGLSVAYNKSAEYAKENGFKWILIADQDTLFHPGILEEYVKSVNENPDIKLFLPKVRVSQAGKYMSPVKKNHYQCRLSNNTPSGSINPSNYAIINSGILINVDAFIEVGGYNEKVWLDFSDFQFLERFTQKYDKAYVINGECIQSFSNENPDINQKINRFRLFCSSVKYFETTKLIDRFWILIAVVKRTISLTKQARNFKPFSILLKEYFK